MRASVVEVVVCTLCPLAGMRCNSCIVQQHPTRLYLYVAATLLGAMMATLIGAVT